MEKEKVTPDDIETSPEKEGVIVYELGYHLVPTLTAEDVAQEASELKAHIEKAGGTVFAEAEPAPFTLAYPMVKKQEGKNATFDTSFFGWVKFEGTGETAVAVGEEVDARKNILRFIIIKTVREYVPPKQRTYLRTVTESSSKTISKPEVVEKNENAKPMSEEELDTAIEELVAE